MIKKLLLFIATATMLAACPGGKPTLKHFNSPLCGAVDGFTVSYFVYGEGEMVIVPLSEVRPETVFVIGLDPLDGFDDAVVTVSGTSGNAGWIDATGYYDGLPRDKYPKKGALEVGCVPDAPVGTSYKFKIEVVKGDVTNILDPRAGVVK